MNFKYAMKKDSRCKEATAFMFVFNLTLYQRTAYRILPRLCQAHATVANWFFDGQSVKNYFLEFTL